MIEPGMPSLIESALLPVLLVLGLAAAITCSYKS